MPSFIYYGVQNRGALKVVTSVHNTWWQASQQDTLPQSRTLRVPGQSWDPYKPATGTNAALSPEDRVVAAATQCGAQEVWKFQLPAAPASGPYDAVGGTPAFDDAEGRVVTGNMLAQVVGVESTLPTGSVVVSWGRNDGPTAKPLSPWSN